MILGRNIMQVCSGVKRINISNTKRDVIAGVVQYSTKKVELI